MSHWTKASLLSVELKLPFLSDRTINVTVGLNLFIYDTESLPMSHQAILNVSDLCKFNFFLVCFSDTKIATKVREMLNGSMFGCCCILSRGVLLFLAGLRPTNLQQYWIEFSSIHMFIYFFFLVNCLFSFWAE